MILVFSLLNHIIACLLIFGAKQVDDFNSTWLKYVPAPSAYEDSIMGIERAQFLVEDSVLYIHASYFSYVAMAGVGVGDLLP